MKPYAAFEYVFVGVFELLSSGTVVTRSAKITTASSAATPMISMVDFAGITIQYCSTSFCVYLNPRREAKGQNS